jgi:hypothetical protein
MQNTKIDYLDEDEPIRNQNYVCLSFLNPEDSIIKNKDLFYFNKFLNKFSNDIELLINNLKEKYPDDKDLINSIKDNHNYIFNIEELNEQFQFFKNTNSNNIEDEYYKNNLKTTQRGIKIRGVYDTEEQAKKRVEILNKKDKYHNIYIAQVGCWLPYESHITNNIEEQEYPEQQLNTLMKHYKENKDQKDIIFDTRTTDAINKNTIEPKLETQFENSTNIISDELNETPDPWLQHKETNKNI